MNKQKQPCNITVVACEIAALAAVGTAWASLAGAETLTLTAISLTTVALVVALIGELAGGG